MKKKLLVLLLIMVSVTVVSQKKKKITLNLLVEINNNLVKSIDSLKNQQITLLNQFNDISTKMVSQEKSNDSLKMDLALHRVKEDNFGSALGSQTAIFSFIIGGLLSITGFVSWGFIRKLVKDSEISTKKIIDQQKIEFNKQIEKINDLEEDLFLNIANSWAMSSQYEQDQKWYHLSIRSSLISAYYYTKSESFENKEDPENIKHETTINNLKRVLKNLDHIIHEGLLKNEIIKNFDEHISYLNKLQQINNLTIIPNLVSEIRYKLNEYVKS